MFSDEDDNDDHHDEDNEDADDEKIDEAGLNRRAQETKRPWERHQAIFCRHSSVRKLVTAPAPQGPSLTIVRGLLSPRSTVPTLTSSPVAFLNTNFGDCSRTGGKKQ